MYMRVKKLVGTSTLLASVVISTGILNVQAEDFFGFSNFKTVQLPQKAVNKVKGVRVNDVLKHLPSIAPSVSEVLAKLESRPDKYFVGGKVKTIHNIYFQKLPKTYGTRVRLVLGAFLKYKNNGFGFETIKVDYDTTESLKEMEVTTVDRRSLLDTEMRVDAALADRKMVVKDMASNIKMVFPLGVGSFDESVLNEGTSILTPRFKRAWLDKRTSLESRKKPRYFAGMPFLRIMTHKTDLQKGHTAIGFHVQPNKDTFVRAFDSHGCMRMQQSDLIALHRIIDFGPTTQIPVTVNFRMEDKAEHPFPKRNKPYKKVYNAGSVEKPDWRLDRDNLVLVTKDWENSAPVSELVDRPEDNYHDLFDYAMAPRKKAKREAHIKMCKEKNVFDPSKYVFDSSPYKVDESKYVVSWDDYKPSYSSDDSDRKKKKKLKKAKKKFKKASKKVAKELERAKKDMEQKRIAAKSEMSRRRVKASETRDANYKKCLDKMKKKRSAKDRLYRWWVHGS